MLLAPGPPSVCTTCARRARLLRLACVLLIAFAALPPLRGIRADEAPRERQGAWWSGFDIEGMNGPVLALATLPHAQPGGSLLEFDLIVGGSFTHAGHLPTGTLARWQGSWAIPDPEFATRWTQLGTIGGYPSRWLPLRFDDPVYALLSYERAGYPDYAYLAIGSSHGLDLFREHASGEDAEMVEIPELPEGPVCALACGELGNRLYVGGNFRDYDLYGVSHVAAWEGGAHWDPLDGGLPGPVTALCETDDGSLLAGGFFHFDEDHPGIFQMAEYDGAWHEIPGELNGPVLTIWEGEGLLLVGGAFSTLNGHDVHFVAQIVDGSLQPWPGSAEVPDGPVHVITHYNEDYQSWIVFGGEFRRPSSSIAIYDLRFEDWAYLGSGTMDGVVQTCVYAAATYRPTDKAGLVAGGDFRTTDPYESRFIALWDSNLPPDGADDPPGERSPVRLAPCYPNPVGARTTIAYSLGSALPVQLTIHDVQGRCLARVVEGIRSPGWHSFEWNGRSEQGERLRSGVYFTRLVTPQGVATRRMVIAGE